MGTLLLSDYGRLDIQAIMLSLPTTVPNVRPSPSIKRYITDCQPNSVMDFDFLSDVLTDNPPEVTGNLLQDLQDRPLTSNKQGNGEDGFQERAAQREIPAPNGTIGSSNQAGAVISKIEDIFESIAESILDQKKEIVIRLKSRQKPGNQKIANQNGPAEAQNEVRFPSRSPQEAWKFGEFAIIRT
jgi:meiotic recombination protein SPO11